MGKRFIAVIIVVLIAITAPFTAYCSQINTLSGIKNSVEGVVSYKCGAEEASSFTELLDKLSESAGSYYADWYYIAFSQYGLDCKNKKSISALKNKVDEFYSGDLSDVKVTDMQRVAFALSACGADITEINGHNLLSDATYNRAKAKPINSQGVNSVAYALLLLDSKNYKIPDNAETTREQMISMILKAELQNGGFALFGENADIDITSIAMQALAPYKNRSDVKSALDKCVNILSSRQDSTGGYKSFSNEISCESTAQVVLCLTSMGIYPAADSRFIKNGNSVMDGINTFKLQNGAFSHFKDGKIDNMATYQALCALVSTYRFMNGEKSFYDFTEKPKPNTVKVNKKPKTTSQKTTNNNSKLENKSTSETETT
ncbi:MAG: terpene cyclase/mutase family protein, partial [Ruminococcus sp.]|nr:terpene cyclase/mutase family protein [Ruminococcus sp.]